MAEPGGVEHWCGEDSTLGSGASGEGRERERRPAPVGNARPSAPRQVSLRPRGSARGGRVPAPGGAPDGQTLARCDVRLQPAACSLQPPASSLQPVAALIAHTHTHRLPGFPGCGPLPPLRTVTLPTAASASPGNERTLVSGGTPHCSQHARKRLSLGHWGRRRSSQKLRRPRRQSLPGRSGARCPGGTVP